MRNHYRLLYFAALCCLGAGAAQSQTPDPVSSRTGGAQNPPKEVVTGIGGFFFKAKDPKALAEWYATNLGVARTPTAKGMEPWHQESGVTAFQPFPATTKYFGPDAQQWML